MVVFPFSNPAHVGVVVRTPENVIERLSYLGIGPFAPPPIPRWIGEICFRGKPSKAKMKAFIGNAAEVDIELLQPLAGETPYQEFLDRRGDGIHHLAFNIDDLDGVVASFVKNGANVIFNGNWEGGGFAYLDLGLNDLIFEAVQGQPKAKISQARKSTLAKLGVGVVTKNAERMVERLLLFGMGPFERLSLPPDYRQNFRGKPYFSTHKSFGTMIGQVRLEIHQPLYEGESPYNELLRRKGEGFSYISFKINNIDIETAKLEMKGYKQYFDSKWEGGQATYLDVGAGGLIIELVQRGSNPI